MDKVEKISTFRAINATLCGVTFAVFTPNRIGEYAGRMLYIHHSNKIRSVAATLIGSFSQIVVTIIMGTLATIIFVFIKYDLPLFYELILFVLVVVIILFSIIAFFNVSVLEWIFFKIRFLRKVLKYIGFFSQYTFKDLTIILSLAMTRYMVYTAQYLLLLNYFGVDMSMLKGFVIISLIFFVQTIIPSIAMMELGIRGNVSLFFLNEFTENTFGVLSASFGLWALNLMLPALIGGVLILRLNIMEDVK